MTTCMPFIMPDGRRLTQLLDHGESEKAGSSAKKGRKNEPRRKVNLNLEPQNEYEAQEFAVAAKLGARSRLRWANDRLLRQLAGPMTAQDMVNLFSPPPFGESKESALQEALRAAPDLWGRLRNVDMDKEALMLQKWREHNAGVRQSAKHSRSVGAGAGRSDAAGAVAAWASVGRKSRAALRKLDIHRVHALEELVVQFVASGEAGTTIALDDSFERCAMHGLASFHGLTSASVSTPDGTRAVRLRPPPATAAPAAPSQIAAAAATRPRYSSSSRSRTRASTGDDHADAAGEAADTSAAGHGSPEASAKPVRGFSAEPAGSSGAAAGVASPASAGPVSGVGAGVPAAVAGTEPGDVQKARQEDIAGGAVGSSGGGGDSGAQRAQHAQRVAASALPFTAVDVLMVLHEDAVARVEAGVTGGLTAAALKQHRAEHLPPELAGGW